MVRYKPDYILTQFVMSIHGCSAVLLSPIVQGKAISYIAEVQFSEARKHESRGEPRLFDVRYIGAGEAIRTLDPNLGKVVLYP